MSRENQTLGLIKYMATCEKVTVTCDKCGKTHTVGAHMVGPADVHNECGGIFRIQEAQ